MRARRTTGRDVIRQHHDGVLTSYMSAKSKARYMPLSIATSVTGGLFAGAVFSQLWKLFSDDDQGPPDPKVSL